MLIVGGGMAAHWLCDRLATLQCLPSLDVTIFGDEPHPPYDRVNLSSMLAGRPAADLHLAGIQWYRDHQIDLVTGRRIVSIDRLRRTITDDSGHTHPYDQLILATGSHPFVPPIPGRDLPGVFVYRTMDDLAAIGQHVAASRESENVPHKVARGAVLGGGLLGLEAARVLHDLGVQTHVLEMAPGLMPRQLDATGAAILKAEVESLGVAVHTVRRTKSIESRPDGCGLTIQSDNAPALDVGVLIIAAGVRPNDSLAASSGLRIGPRGGVWVDDSLQTSDPNIFAIGECASHRDHVYGLVAPCYRMGDVLASRIAGERPRFLGADESAELKLLGTPVAALGQTIGETPAGVVLTHRDGSNYRKLLLVQGRLVGASCVGDWPELPQVRQAIARGDRLWPWQRQRFGGTGTIWGEGPLPIDQWPAEATVCSCLNITRGQISAAVAGGAQTDAAITAACGAGSACGTCRPLLAQLAGGPAKPVVVPGAKTMAAASIAGLIFAAVWLIAPPIPLADSVQSAWRNVDILWRSDLARQISGYSLLTLTAAGLLFSLRKRTHILKLGSYGFWRAAHGVLGAAVLVGMVVHTGLRMGDNLNFLLAAFFLAAALVGSLAGILASAESRVTAGSMARRVRWLRPKVAAWHLWVTWPLPVLIVLHVLSFYWYRGGAP